MQILINVSGDLRHNEDKEWKVGFFEALAESPSSIYY